MKDKVFLFTAYSGTLEKVFTSQGGRVTYDDTAYHDVVVFPSGENVSPFLYGETKMRGVECNFVRDMKENRLYRGLNSKMPKIGIGRGAHFLNIMNGGTMYQKVSGHKTGHEMMDFMTGNVLYVTSLHDQEMIAHPQHAAVLACGRAADRKERPHKLEVIDIDHRSKTDYFDDTEILWYGENTSLCFEPRPDFDHNVKGAKETYRLFIDYYNDWIEPSITEFNSKRNAV